MVIHDRTTKPQLNMEPAVDPEAALRTAIESDYQRLRQSVEVLVWKMGAAHSRNEIVDVAAEVLHEALTRALQKSATYDPSRPAHAWLFAISTNVLRERQRKMKRSRLRQAPAHPGNADSVGDPSDTVLEQVYDTAANNHERLLELLDLVSPADQLVLRLRFIDQLTGRDLAAALGTSEGAARVRVSRAVARLATAYHRAEQVGREDH